MARFQKINNIIKKPALFRLFYLKLVFKRNPTLNYLAIPIKGTLFSDHSSFLKLP